MEFKFNVNDFLKTPIIEINQTLIPPGFNGDRRALWDVVGKITEIVNAVGEASASAQGLTKPITSADRLRNSDQTLYLLLDKDAKSGKGVVSGMLKTGKKGLYVFDRDGHHYQVSPHCVLDFYVHESRQRMGLGKHLFEHMLQKENVEPVKLAIDRPSEKLLAFLNKHYSLNSPVRQMNNYVVYDGFFPEPLQNEQIGDNNNVNNSGIPVKNIQSANGLQPSYTSPYGRYGAPRPTCSMGQIIHNHSPIVQQSEPSGVNLSNKPTTGRSATQSAPNIPNLQNHSVNMTTQSIPNMPQQSLQQTSQYYGQVGQNVLAPQAGQQNHNLSSQQQYMQGQMQQHIPKNQYATPQMQVSTQALPAHHNFVQNAVEQNTQATQNVPAQYIHSSPQSHQPINQPNVPQQPPATAEYINPPSQIPQYIQQLPYSSMANQVTSQHYMQPMMPQNNEQQYQSVPNINSAVQQQFVPNTQPTQPMLRLEDMQAVQKTQLYQNLQPVQNMQIVPNTQSVYNLGPNQYTQPNQSIQPQASQIMQPVPPMEPTSAIQPNQSMQPTHGIQTGQNIQPVQSVSAILPVQNIQHTQNLQQAQNMLQIQNMQQTPNMQQSEKVPVQNMQQPQNIQRVQNMQQAHHAHLQNMQQAQNVHQTPNFQNVPVQQQSIQNVPVQQRSIQNIQAQQSNVTGTTWQDVHTPIINQPYQSMPTNQENLNQPQDAAKYQYYNSNAPVLQTNYRQPPHRPGQMMSQNPLNERLLASVRPDTTGDIRSVKTTSQVKSTTEHFEQNNPVASNPSIGKIPTTGIQGQMYNGPQIASQ